MTAFDLFQRSTVLYGDGDLAGATKCLDDAIAQIDADGVDIHMRDDIDALRVKLSGDWRTYAGWLPEFGHAYELTLDDMTFVLEMFCKLTGAPSESADELILYKGIDNHVFAWLDAYNMVWDELSEAKNNPCNS